jgi:hypothetical protein
MKNSLLHILVVCALALSGCATTKVIAVKQPFPTVGPELLTNCDPLQEVSDPTTLSKLTETVAKNYTTYYICSTKVEGWIEWYKQQQANDNQ